MYFRVPRLNMANHGLTSALTRYRARTLTLSQAAARAGVSESAFLHQIKRRGIEVEDPELEPTPLVEDPQASAD